MALGTTNISIRLVKETIGDASNDIKGLCTSGKVNKWSKCRPGYWYRDSSVPPKILFQSPRGGSVSDVRGLDSELGISVEAYKLGDFRDYNHSANTGGINDYDKELIIKVLEGQTPLTRSLTLNMGEVDWYNESGLFRAKNAVMGALTPPTKICLCYFSGSTLKVLSNSNGSSEIAVSAYSMEGNNKVYQVPVYAPEQVGGTTTYNLYVTLKNDQNNISYFPIVNMTKKVTVKTVLSTIAIYVNMDTGAGDTFYSKINQSSLKEEDRVAGTTVGLIMCDTNMRVAMPVASGDTITIPNSAINDFYIEMYRAGSGSYNKYDIPPRWTYYYRIEVSRDGSVVATGTGSYNCASVSGIPTMKFTCPTNLEYGDIINVYLTNMNQCSLSYRG